MTHGDFWTPLHFLTIMRDMGPLRREDGSLETISIQIQEEVHHVAGWKGVKRQQNSEQTFP